MPNAQPQLKLGKTPARKDAVKFKFSDYLSLPTPPTKYGHQSLVTDWQGMLGNDSAGDCVWAGAGHETILWNKEAGQSVVFSTASVLSDYSAVTGYVPGKPNTDKGTDMSVAASYRRKTGVVDAKGTRHKIAAYLAIAVGNETELKQAICTFSNVGIGIQFPASAMSQFNAGKAWTVVSGSQIEGGHYIPAIGYDSSYVYIVTWGRVQKMSWGFFKKYCDEALVYLSDEMLSGGKSIDGLNVNQLNADLGSLPTQAGGKTMSTSSTVSFWDTNVGKTIKAAVYVALSAGLAKLILATNNDPTLFGGVTILVNIVLVYVQKTFFDSDTPNLGPL